MEQTVSSRLIICVIGVSLPVLGGPVCSNSDEGADQLTAVASSTAGSVEPVEPQFGGVTQPLGPYFAEIRPQDKQLEVQVRDRSGETVPMKGASLTARLGGSDEPVQVVMTPRGQKFVGDIVSADGPGPVVLAYSPPGDPTVIDTTFPNIPLPVVVADISPRHHGQVSYVGDHRVEFTVGPEGEVMASVTDLAGVPVPPREVDFDQVRLVTPSGPQVVDLRPRGAVFVGALPAPAPPSFSVTFDLDVGGQPYHDVHLVGYHPVASHVEVVAPPPPPFWGVPAVDVRFGGHPGRGWAKGHYRHHKHPGKRGWGKAHYRHGRKGWGKAYYRHGGKGRGKAHYRHGHPGKGRGKGHRRGRGHGKRW